MKCDLQLSYHVFEYTAVDISNTAIQMVRHEQDWIKRG